MGKMKELFGTVEDYMLKNKKSYKQSIKDLSLEEFLNGKK